MFAKANWVGWRPRPFFHYGIPSMAYESQPSAGGQREEKAFRCVPNPRGDAPWPVERARHLATRLERLFNRDPSGWPPRDGWVELGPVLKLMAHGSVQIRLIRLPLQACAEASNRHIFGTRAESAEHIRLKLAAIAWMKGQGARDACAECVHVAGRSDACSIARDWIVECGHTRMGKLVDAIAGMRAGRFTLIPFQPLARWDQSVRPLLAIDFSWTKPASVEAEEFQHQKRRALAYESRGISLPSGP